MSKDGGSAFPLPLGTMNAAEPEQSGGMTLRDYFAARAMQGLMGRVWGEDGKPPENILEIWAKSAYKMADAMLAERSSLTNAS